MTSNHLFQSKSKTKIEKIEKKDSRKTKNGQNVYKKMIINYELFLKSSIKSHPNLSMCAL
jgi:hypothetical protein